MIVDARTSMAEVVASPTIALLIAAVAVAPSPSRYTPDPIDEPDPLTVLAVSVLLSTVSEPLRLKTAPPRPALDCKMEPVILPSAELLANVLFVIVTVPPLLKTAPPIPAP